MPSIAYPPWLLLPQSGQAKSSPTDPISSQAGCACGVEFHLESSSARATLSLSRISPACLMHLAWKSVRSVSTPLMIAQASACLSSVVCVLRLVHLDALLLFDRDLDIERCVSGLTGLSLVVLRGEAPLVLEAAFDAVGQVRLRVSIKVSSLASPSSGSLSEPG